MAKRLMTLVGMLAVLLATAVPAFAQEQVTVTGTLGPFDEVFQVDTSTTMCAGNPCPPYGLIDSVSGRGYGFYTNQDLSAYVGEYVTVSGALRLEGFQGGPSLIDLSSIEPATEETATVSFALTVEGEPPAGAEFFGAAQAEGRPTPLTDPDGDGIYFGYVEVPTRPLPILILQQVDDEPYEVIKDFGEVTIDADKLFEASVSFDSDGNSSNNSGSGSGGSSGSGSSGSGSNGGSGSSGSGSVSSGTGSSGGGGSSSSGSSSSSSGKSNPAGGSSSGSSSSSSGGGAKAGGAKVKELPRTGGDTLPALGLVGALLVSGGLLVRRTAR